MLGDDDELEPRGREALVAEALAAARRARRPRGRRSRRPAACAGASCSARSVAELLRHVRASTTCQVALSGIAAATIVGRRSSRAQRAVESERGRPAPDPVRRSSAWAASAATSSATAPTRTCCSCTTRCPGADERDAARRPPTRSPASCAALLLIPQPGPALLEVDADLRPEGASGPLVRTLALLRRLLRALVAGLGGAGAAARRTGRGRRGARPRASSSSSTRCATPREGSRRTTYARSGGSRRGWSPSGCRAAPTPGCTPSSAAAAWPTSSGPCSCCSCGTGTTYPALRTTRTRAALAAAARRRR